MGTLSFERRWGEYRHWRVEVDRPSPRSAMEVDPDGGLRDGLRAEAELLRPRRRHRAGRRRPAPALRAPRGPRRRRSPAGSTRCSAPGANIQMLAASTHHHKVNFCKFTNETRNAIEDATAHSGQTWLAAVNGTAAGGGYELALACDEIVLVDDRASAVSLPEVPLLAVLPGTGGLTRLVDKRHVRRDLADVFATRAEGVKGPQALDVGPRRRGRAAQPLRRPRSRARAAGERQRSPTGPPTVPASCWPARVARGADVRVRVDVERRARPSSPSPGRPRRRPARRPDDDRRLRLVGPGRRRASSTTPSCTCASTSPRSARGCCARTATRKPSSPPTTSLRRHAEHWLARRDAPATGRARSSASTSSARTLVALVEPGSCFAGTLAELVLAADRSFMLDGPWRRRPPTVDPAADAANDGWYPMANGRSRLRTRFCDDEGAVAAVAASFGKELGAADAAARARHVRPRRHRLGRRGPR